MDPEITQEFIRSIIGDYSLGKWLAYFFFAILGLILYSWKEESAPHRKTKFKFKTFISGNVKRFIFTILLIYIQFRFYENISNTSISEYAAFLMGFTANGLVGMGKDKLTKSN